MDKVWPSYMNGQCICFCTIPAARHKFEAFISKAVPFQRRLTYPVMYLLEPKGVGVEQSVLNEL
jgi:hypothetical protein